MRVRGRTHAQPPPWSVYVPAMELFVAPVLFAALGVVTGRRWDVALAVAVCAAVVPFLVLNNGWYGAGGGDGGIAGNILVACLTVAGAAAGVAVGGSLRR